MEVMNSEYFEISVDGNTIAQYMPLQFALILTKAIYSEFYAEPKLAVTIEKMQLETEADDSEVKEING